MILNELFADFVSKGDELSYNNNMPFTTKDADNDNYDGGNCAVSFNGAWWFNHCGDSNLNGMYPGDSRSFSHGEIYWNRFLKHTEMKIRPYGV